MVRGKQDVRARSHERRFFTSSGHAEDRACRVSVEERTNRTFSRSSHADAQPDFGPLVRSPVRTHMPLRGHPVMAPVADEQILLV